MTQENTALLEAGEVRWHSSEDDGGPDVGILVGLGDGKELWLGELLDDECGGMGFAVYDPAKIAVASLSNWDDVREIVEQHIAPALAALSSPTPAQVEPRNMDAIAKLIDAEVELHRCRSAKDASTFGGRNRTDAALSEFNRLRAELSQTHPPAAGDSEAGRLREALEDVLRHERSNFMGADGEKAKRASWRGVMRKVRAALAGSEGGR